MRTTWTAILLCCCACFLKGTSGSPRSRHDKLFQHPLYRHVDDGANLTDSSLSFSNQTWVKCQILERLLEHYMSGFPEVQKAIDSIPIPHLAINTTLRRVAHIWPYIQNPRLIEDLLVNDLGRMILDQRVKCTITMYQKVFIYAMIKQMEAMMASGDQSMLHQVIQIIARHLPTRPDVIILAPQIIYTVHGIVFEGIIDSLRQAEFRYLDWFLYSFGEKVRLSFEENANPTPDVLFTEMSGIIQGEMRIFPEVWMCTSADDFLDIHKLVAGMFSDHYFKMLRTGYVSAIVVGNINLLFRLPGNGLSAPIDMDSADVDLVMRDLQEIIVNYATEVMNKTAAYEQFLITDGLTQPPLDLLSILTPSEVNDTWTLFTRGFGPTPSPGPGTITLTDTYNQGQQELSVLKNVTAALTDNSSTDPDIIIQLNNIISDKENFLARVGNQIGGIP